jgi:hypothetical protein
MHQGGQVVSFSADVDTRAYMQAMRLLGKEVLPEVMAETLNQTADAVTARSLRNLQRRLTVRTKFTTNSLTRAGAKPYRALNKARGTNTQRMFSRAGSISPYLGIQDTGDTKRAERSRVPIPTRNARTARSEQRSIARRYNLRNMGPAKGAYLMGKPQGTDLPTGLYERKGRRLIMLRNLAHAQVTVPATRWHRDAADELGSPRLIAARFRRNAQRRLARMQSRRRR